MIIGTLFTLYWCEVFTLVFCLKILHILYIILLDYISLICEYILCHGIFTIILTGFILQTECTCLW